MWSPEDSTACWWLHSVSTVDQSLDIILVTTIHLDKKIEDSLPPSKILNPQQKSLFSFVPCSYGSILYLLIKTIWKYLDTDVSNSTADDTGFLRTKYDLK